MRYEKPMVMDLSAGARAAGLEPYGCFDGNAPSSGSYWCYTGTSVSNPNDYVCTVGPGPGVSTVNGSCFSGGVVAGVLKVCQLGSGANTTETCTVGNSNIV